MSCVEESHKYIILSETTRRCEVCGIESKKTEDGIWIDVFTPESTQYFMKHYLDRIEARKVTKKDKDQAK